MQTKKERLVKAPDGSELPIIAPNEIADFMEQLGTEITQESTRVDAVLTDPGRPTRVLFVCAGNFCRSPTGEHLLKLVEGYEVKSCGLFRGAVVEVTRELIDWADTIIVMETYMKDHLQQFTNPDKIKVLNIPDMYAYGNPQLVELLANRMLPYGIDATHAVSKFKPYTEEVKCKRMIGGTIDKHMCTGKCTTCWITKEFEYQ